MFVTLTLKVKVTGQGQGQIQIFWRCVFFIRFQYVRARLGATENNCPNTFP